MRKNKTKIVCTLSRFLNNKEILKKLIITGMSVARINFSHSTYDEADELIKKLKELRKELQVPLSIMLDTKGPEVRIYGYKKEIILDKGNILTVKSYIKDDITEIISDKNVFLTNLPNIGTLVTIDKVILLMDGYFKARVIEIEDSNRIKIEIINSGALREKAHLSIPKADYGLPFLSDNDIEDIKYAIDRDLEYIALSFVSSYKDIEYVKKIIYKENPESKIKLISKIENNNSVNGLDKIIYYSDGIMVARGDLGVELELEKVPILQKKIIYKSYLSGLPVITATQMIESMIETPIPTRAEVSDIANSCYDKTSAVMLSGETAIGKYPLLVVETMKKILLTAEENINYEKDFFSKKNVSYDLTSVITYSAVLSAYKIKAKAIIVLTKSGYSARMISKLRPNIPIFAFTVDKTVYNQLSLNWGVNPMLISENINIEVLIHKVVDICKKKKLLLIGDKIVLVAGLPLGISGKTNMIRIEEVN